MDYLPIFCQIKDKPCLLVGAGEVAERKARLLLDAGAKLFVSALTFTPQFHAWQQQNDVHLIQAEFSPEFLDDKWLVIAATHDNQLNQSVREACEQRKIFCNVVDNQALASFIMPSIIDRSPVIVAVSSMGKAPVLARLLREKIESLLPTHLGELARFAGSLRQKVKQLFVSDNQRRRFWEKLFTSDRLAQALANKDNEKVAQITDHLLHSKVEDRGEVVLVGAGPGDAGLLTLKGLQQIQLADIIVYDRLVSDEVMNLVRRDATRIFVGKKPGNHCVPQEQINQILLAQAKSGKRVVRLKGGDPFIFGRGGEELEVLLTENIPFSVVPGVTAASGCAAYSGIPLTHRDYANSIRLITGHVKDGSALDWASLAGEKQTLVFYMGLSQAPLIQENLIDNGMNPLTEVAIVEAGTTVNQKVFTGQLNQLTQISTTAKSPSLIIIGPVVALREKLNFFK